MTPTPSADPCEDLIAAIELAVDGINPEHRAAHIREMADRNPACGPAILAHFQLTGQLRPHSPPNTHQFREGDRVGPFRVVRFIAHGGMGEVYEATDETLDRQVALKVISPQRVAPSTRERFRREGVVLADVHHTRIVPIHASGEDGGVQYLALQYVRGITLQRVLTAVQQDAGGRNRSSSSIRGLVGPLLSSATPASQAPTTTRQRFRSEYFFSIAEVIAQVADGLHHAHERGYCHRDVKPSNVMLDTEGACWLIDFGLAGYTATGQVIGELATESGFTRGPLGTPEYMAPEQFDTRADARTDVWGLGVTLYELLALRRPFIGESLSELERQVRHTHPTPPRHVVPELPADLQSICLRALAKDPADRYPTAASMADDLRRWLTWRPTVARPGWPTLRPLRLWAWRHKALTAALLLALVLVLGISLWGYQRSEARLAAVAEQAERRRKEVAFLKVQEQVTAFRRIGYGHVDWPAELHQLLDEMHELQPEAQLRDLRAATLTGLDSRLDFTYSVPQDPGEHRGYSGVAFSPSGKRIAVGGVRFLSSRGVENTPGLVWAKDFVGEPTVAAEVGSGLVAFLDEEIPVQLLEPTPDRPNVLLWNLDSNRSLAEVPAPKVVGAIAIAPGGRLFAVSGSADGRGETVVWEYTPGSPGATREVARQEVAASALAFSPDGRFLAVGTSAGVVTVHSLFDERAAVELPDVRMHVKSLAFGRMFVRPGGDRLQFVSGGIPGLQLAIGTLSGVLQIVNLETRAVVTASHDFSHFLNALAFSPDGATLAVAGHRIPVLLDVATGRVRFEFSGRAGKVVNRSVHNGVAFSPDGQRIAFTGFSHYGNGCGGVDVFSLDQNRGVRAYHGLTGWVQKTCLSATRKWVAALSHPWQVGVWERETGRLVFVWDVPAGEWVDNADLTFDTNETSVYVAGGRRISRYCLTTGARLGHWELPDGLNDALVARPGGAVWSMRREQDAKDEWRVILLRKLNSGGTAEISYRRTRPEESIDRVRLSADGTRLNFVNGEKKVIAWEVESGKPTPVEPVDPNGWAMESSTLPSSATGVKLYQACQPESAILFDLGNTATTPTDDVLPADARFVHWGRRDGTVLVADLNQCLKALEKYPR